MTEHGSRFQLQTRESGDRPRCKSWRISAASKRPGGSPAARRDNTNPPSEELSQHLLSCLDRQHLWRAPNQLSAWAGEWVSGVRALALPVMDKNVEKKKKKKCWMWCPKSTQGPMLYVTPKHCTLINCPNRLCCSHCPKKSCILSSCPNCRLLASCLNMLFLYWPTCGISLMPKNYPLQRKSCVLYRPLIIHYSFIPLCFHPHIFANFEMDAAGNDAKISQDKF